MSYPWTAGEVLTAADLNAALGPTRILQVVSTAKADTFSGAVASGASTDITGLSASITPSSTSSKILVVAIVNGSRSTGDVPNLPIAITRSGTLIGVGSTAGNRTSVGGVHMTFSANANSIANAQLVFLDNPASTSALTYQVVLRGVAGSTVTYVVNRTSGDTDAAGHPRALSSLTVMEVVQ